MAWISRTEHVKVSEGWLWTEDVRVYSITLHEQTGLPTFSLRQASPHWWGIAVNRVRHKTAGPTWTGLSKKQSKQDYTWYPLGTRWVSNWTNCNFVICSSPMQINNATASGMVKQGWGERGVTMGAKQLYGAAIRSNYRTRGARQQGPQNQIKSGSVACSAWPAKWIVSSHSSDLQPYNPRDAENMKIQDLLDIITCQMLTG
jgi:hypothetical protein